jgi:hypothetical protein
VTPRRSVSRALAGRWLGLLLLFAAACACPTPVERWDTPQATLALWQARLCHDDPEREYACLSCGFQKSFGGYQNYFAARTALLEQNATAAWLFGHADLLDHVRDVSFEADGQHAAIVLESGDSSLVVSFEREAWVTATWDDGRSVTARQRVPLDALVVNDGNQQWLRVDRPELTDTPHLGELRVAGRWLISDLAGLAGLAAEGNTVESAP